MPSQESSPVTTPMATPTPTPRSARTPRTPRRPSALDLEDHFNPDMVRLLMSEGGLWDAGKENSPPTFIQRAARREHGPQGRLSPRRLDTVLALHELNIVD